MTSTHYDTTPALIAAATIAGWASRRSGSDNATTASVAIYVPNWGVEAAIRAVVGPEVAEERIEGARRTWWVCLDEHERDVAGGADPSRPPLLLDEVVPSIMRTGTVAENIALRDAFWSALAFNLRQAFNLPEGSQLTSWENTDDGAVLYFRRPEHTEGDEMETIRLAVEIASQWGYRWEDGTPVRPGDETRVDDETLLDLEELAARGLTAAEIVHVFGGWGVYVPHGRREAR